MLDIKLIRDNPDAVKAGLANRNADTHVIDEVLKMDAGWRHITEATEKNQNFVNEASKQVGAWLRELKSNVDAPPPAGVRDIVLRLKDLADHITGEAGPVIWEADIESAAKSPDILRKHIGIVGKYISESKLRADELRAEIDDRLLRVPNLPDPQTPVGKSEEENVVRKEWGTKPEFDFEPKAHWDLVGDKGLDLEIGGRISGSGFPFLRGKIAKLERALINFFLELHTGEHGYTECWTPFMVRGETLRNSSQLPKFYDDLYRADERDDLFLIPTAEVPLTSVHAGEIIPDDQAPIRYCAFTPCFRREAGAAGKDTRGILRVHQFSKVELMVVTTPERSEEEHETLTRCAETVLERLNIPHRRLELCTGDMGFGAQRCFDLEAWAPGVGKWLEVSSCSNFGDFQARRAKIRVRGDDKKARLAHTLNGSGLAVPRTMIAILENNQQPDGTINIPEALQPFYGAEKL